MPKMNGIEATVAIRKWERETEHRRTVIISVTASAMDHEIEQYLGSGMDMALTKPLDIPKLLGAMRSACMASHTG